MPNVYPNFIAKGTIRTSRFVKMDVANDFAVIEADANDKVIGIAQEGARTAPIPGATVTDAAIADDQLRVHGPGEDCLLELGGTVVRGDFLKSDADGKGVSIATTGTTLQRYGAYALESGASAEKIRVAVTIGSERPAIV